MSVFSIFNIFKEDSGRIDADELKAMLDGNAVCTVIDVRTPEEFQGGHIPGSVSVPLSEIERLGEAPQKGRIVLCCARGARSMKARDILISRGVKDVIDLKGGIGEWVRAGGRLAKR